MSNDSTTACPLTPLDVSNSYGQKLERSLSQWVRAVSGLPDGMVRPRWTATQPAFPAPDVNWCGFGIVSFDADDNPAFVTKTDDTDEMWRHELVECIASFYGEDSQDIAAQFRDGITVSQNNEFLKSFGLSIADHSQIIAAPELINQQWVRRYDITIRLRRKLTREYGIRKIADAPVKFFGD